MLTFGVVVEDGSLVGDIGDTWNIVHQLRCGDQHLLHQRNIIVIRGHQHVYILQHTVVQSVLDVKL